MKTISFQAAGFEAVYQENYGKVYNYVYRLLLNRENTEDVVSETFIKAWEAYPRYDATRAAVCTWLCAIARNCALNFLHAAAQRVNASWEELWTKGQIPETPEEHWEKDSAEETVWEVLRHLSVEERDFLNLRYVLELSNREISELLHSNEKAISARYGRLLAKCRKIAEFSE